MKKLLQWDPALRVPPAETRLTVYRRLQVIPETMCWPAGRSAIIYSLDAVIWKFLEIWPRDLQTKAIPIYSSSRRN